MCFKNKSDTNIDSEFDKKNFDIKKYKIPLIIFGIVIILAIIIFLINFGAFNKVVNEEVNYFLSLDGKQIITVYQGSEYVEPGYLGRDSLGNNLTDEVVVSSNVDTSVVGYYEVVYKLYDKKLIRYVAVVNKPAGVPSIYLIGNSTMYLYVNSEYVEPGYIAIDSKDATLTDKVVVSNNVDTSKAGTYFVTYSVTNSSGVTVQSKREIIIVNRIINNPIDDSGDNLGDDPIDNPVSFKVKSSISEVVNNSVTISIEITGKGYSHTILPNNTKTTTTKMSYKVYKDGTYKFIIYDIKGNAEIKSIKINKFSSLKPVITSINKNGPIVTVKASSANGITGYLFSTSSTTPTGNEKNWVDSTSNVLEVAKYVGKYYVFVRDGKNRFSDYKEIEITMDEIYKKSPKSRVKDYYLTAPIEQFLSSRGDSVDNLNNFIATSVLSAGLFTREGVVTSAVAVLNYLYLKHGVQIPYFSNINCSGTRYYKEFGANPKWGVAMDEGKCGYPYVGFDCASFVGWTIHNGGFRGENTIESYRVRGATVTKKCNSYDGNNCIGMKSKNEMYEAYKKLKYGDAVASGKHVVLVLNQYDDNRDGKADGIYIFESHGGAGIKKFSWAFLYNSKYYILADMTKMYSNVNAYSCKVNVTIPDAWIKFKSQFNNCTL